MLNADEMRQTTIAVVVTVVGVLLMFWGETYRRQTTYFAEGERLVEAGNYRQAISSFESALHMYTPGSGSIEKAKDRLLDIARKYENEGDLDMALIAYRTLRSSFYATRSFYTPYKNVITDCDLRIEDLVRRQQEALAQATPGESGDATPAESTQTTAPTSAE